MSTPVPVELDLSADANSAAAAPPADFAPSVVLIEPAESLCYAAPEKVWEAHESTDETGDADASRRFQKDAWRSFIYPFKPAENAVVFSIAACISLLIPALEYVITLPNVLLYRPHVLAVAAYVLVFGYLAALYMCIVQETAAGSSDMPSLKMENGILDELIMPMLRYFGSFAVATLPATLYMLSRALDAPLPAKGRIPLLAIGAFFWPIILLLFATESLGVLYRLDLICKTIARTSQAYLTLWALLLALGIVGCFASPGILVKSVGIPLEKLRFSQPGVFGKLGLCVLQTYLTIVSMRLIGLYYWHFKRRFAIVLE